MPLIDIHVLEGVFTPEEKAAMIRETALGFGRVAGDAHAAGVRRDAAVANDGVGAGALNADFNMFWDYAATITDTGWFAEVRISFSSLRFQPVDGRVVMGLSALRYLGKKNEMDLFPAIPPDWG